MLDIKKTAETSKDKITKIEDVNSKMLWLVGSGIFTAGLPVVIELIRYIVSLFH